MPAIGPGQPVTPGIATPASGYPQYGVGGGTPGKPGGWKIVTAATSKEKLSYLQQGFLVWFTSESAAQAYVASESSPYTSGNPPAPPNPLFGLFGIAGSLEALFGALTDGKMWRSLGWIILGILLMLAGLLLWIGPGAARRSPIGLAAEELG